MKPMKPLKINVSITLDPDIIESIKKLSDYNDRSFSRYINMVLREHINQLSENDKAER